MSPGYMGENHGTCEETGKQHGRIFRYRGSGMYEKCGSELERPYPSPKGKKKAYKLGEIVFLMGVILSILVDTFISKISLPMQPVPEIRSISGA